MFLVASRSSRTVDRSLASPSSSVRNVRQIGQSGRFFVFDDPTLSRAAAPEDLHQSPAAVVRSETPAFRLTTHHGPPSEIETAPPPPPRSDRTGTDRVGRVAAVRVDANRKTMIIIVIL